MLSNRKKIELIGMSRELYAGNANLKPVLFCSNGIYKLCINKPTPKHMGDNYCFIEFFEYNKYSRKFEYVSAYGDTTVQAMSFELRERFKLD